MQNHFDKAKNNKFEVLIADDDKFVRSIARIILKDAGYVNITEVSSSEEAIEILADKKFDLALVDIKMGEIDGLELTKMIRKSSRLNAVQLAIVIISSSCDQNTFDRAAKSGIDQYCLKPLNPMNLLKRIQFAMDKRRAYYN